MKPYKIVLVALLLAGCFTQANASGFKEKIDQAIKNSKLVIITNKIDENYSKSGIAFTAQDGQKCIYSGACGIQHAKRAATTASDMLYLDNEYNGETINIFFIKRSEFEIKVKVEIYFSGQRIEEITKTLTKGSSKCTIGEFTGDQFKSNFSCN